VPGFMPACLAVWSDTGYDRGPERGSVQGADPGGGNTPPQGRTGYEGEEPVISSGSKGDLKGAVSHYAPPPHSERGTKRTVHDRRGEPPPVSPAPSCEEEFSDFTTWGRQRRAPPPSQTTDPAAGVGVEHERSLSPMARFAAADPQVTGILQDIVQSLRGLEGRLGALEGRVSWLRPQFRPPVRARKRKKKKKGERSAADGPSGPKPPYAATPKVTAPPARARAWDLWAPRRARRRRSRPG